MNDAIYCIYHTFHRNVNIMTDVGVRRMTDIDYCDIYVSLPYTPFKIMAWRL